MISIKRIIRSIFQWEIMEPDLDIIIIRGDSARFTAAYFLAKKIWVLQCKYYFPLLSECLKKSVEKLEAYSKVI